MEIQIPQSFPSHLDTNACGAFITVEGNIGIGKSTLCTQLCELRGDKARCFQEPVDKEDFRWFLGNYYADPKRWGMTFQMYCLKERFKQHTLASELVVNGLDVIQDRAIYSDGCFGRLVHADGNMTDEEWRVYAETFGAMKRFLRYPDLMVYLRADPEVCHMRTKSRGRSEESGVPLDYLARLHREHEELAEAMSRFTRVVIFDWNEFPSDIVDINNRINEALTTEVRFLRDFCKL